MADHSSTMQSERRIDPAAREGMKRILAMYDSEAQVKLVRDLLKGVKRPVAVAIYNEHIIGLKLPGNADRVRIGQMLRTVVRAGRPDAYDCLQSLSTIHFEDTLSDEQYEVYNDAVEKLNEAVDSDNQKGIKAAAIPVVQALRAALDHDAIERYVALHALPETHAALIAAVRGTKATSSSAASGKQKTPAEADPSQKKPAAKGGAKKSTAKRGTSKQAPPKKAPAASTTKKGGTRKSAPKKRG